MASRVETINHCWGLAGVKTTKDIISNDSYKDSVLRTGLSILPVIGTITFIFNRIRANTLCEYLETSLPKDYDADFSDAKASIYNTYNGLHALSAFGNITLLITGVALGVFSLNAFTLTAIGLSAFLVWRNQHDIKYVLHMQLISPHTRFYSTAKMVLSILPFIGAITFLYNNKYDGIEVTKIKDEQLAKKKAGLADPDSWVSIRIEETRSKKFVHLAVSSAGNCAILAYTVAKGILVAGVALKVIGVLSLLSTLYGLSKIHSFILINPNHKPSGF